MAKYKDRTITPGGDQLSERLACPMCGWLRPVKWGYSQRTGEKREVRFDKMDLETAPLWRQERLTGGGRGSHNSTIELIDSKTLSELPQEIKEQIKRQAELILSYLETTEK